MMALVLTRSRIVRVSIECVCMCVCMGVFVNQRSTGLRFGLNIIWNS